MSWRTNGAVVKLRKMSRSLGLNQLISKMIYVNGYETGYDLPFQKQLRFGDCVWDSGANVGHCNNIFKMSR